MYLLRGFRIVVIKGDQEFASISDQVVTLPTSPSVDWAAAVQHCGLIERNIRFVKEKGPVPQAQSSIYPRAGYYGYPNGTTYCQVCKWFPTTRRPKILLAGTNHDWSWHTC